MSKEECDYIMQSKTEETVTISADELKKLYAGEKDYVGEKLNNPIVVWLVVFAIGAWTANMVWNNINSGIDRANGKAEEALELISDVQSNIQDVTNTQQNLVAALGKITGQLETMTNDMFSIKTTRFSDKDANDFKEEWKEDDDELAKDLSKLELRLAALEARVSEMSATVMLSKENAQRLNERTDFIADTRKRLNDLERGQ